MNVLDEIVLLSIIILPGQTSITSVSLFCYYQIISMNYKLLLVNKEQENRKFKHINCCYLFPKFSFLLSDITDFNSNRFCKESCVFIHVVHFKISSVKSLVVEINILKMFDLNRNLYR